MCVETNACSVRCASPQGPIESDNNIQVYTNVPIRADRVPQSTHGPCTHRIALRRYTASSPKRVPENERYAIARANHSALLYLSRRISPVPAL